MSENIEDEENEFERCKSIKMVTISVVSGPKKPNDELSESKVITAAASNYKAKVNTFSPESGKFKVFEASTASAELINSSAPPKVLSAEIEKEENRPL